jgi:photosystem II stability/assembly factor-like uncharacterized protein
MRYCALVLAIVLAGYLTIAALRRGNDSVRTTNPQPPEVTTVLRPVPAILNEDSVPSLAAVETRIKGKTGGRFEFNRVQFISENNGWVMGNYSIYRTKDGGKRWVRLPQEPEKEAYFTAFSFVNESLGWLAIVKHGYAEHYGVGISSAIMVSNDGGQSWTSPASFPNEVEIRDVRFFNETEGLAVGVKGLDNRADRRELFVARTSNGGKEWYDISESAKLALQNQWGVANDSGQYIQLTPSALLLLTQGGRIMSTTDQGKTWNTIVIFEYKHPDGYTSGTAYYKLALDTEGRIRVVGGTMGDEGYRGDFVVSEEGQWTSYELRGTPILDSVFLSDKDVVACGQNVVPVTEKSKRHDDAGVILRSFDSGKSWNTIYRSKSAETFFFITRIKDGDFYAVSDTGTFLCFNLPQ